VDESRPRFPVIPPQSLIFTDAARPLWSRLRDAVLTTALWGLYIWLNRDLFLVLRDVPLWLAGGGITPAIRQAVGLVETLGTYSAVVAVNTLLVVAWALYNQLRFRGKERRRFSQAVSPAEIAERYGRSADEICAWQEARILVIYHGSDDQIEHVATEPLFSGVAHDGDPASR
jgi:biofilm PGA synthesis protein PgaD